MRFVATARPEEQIFTVGAFSFISFIVFLRYWFLYPHGTFRLNCSLNGKQFQGVFSNVDNYFRNKEGSIRIVAAKRSANYRGGDLYNRSQELSERLLWQTQLETSFEGSFNVELPELTTELLNPYVRWYLLLEFKGKKRAFASFDLRDLLA